MTYGAKTDYPDQRYFVIGCHSPESVGMHHVGMGTGISSTATAYGTAEMALYVPLYLASDFHVVRMWYAAGTSSGNIDIGLYTEAGSKIVSLGPTAMAGSSNLTPVTVDARLTAPARYYMAIWCSNTTASFHRLGTNTGELAAVLGIAQQTGLASGLPATFSLSKITTANAACVPNFGIAGRTTI